MRLSTGQCRERWYVHRLPQYVNGRGGRLIIGTTDRIGKNEIAERSIQNSAGTPQPDHGFRLVRTWIRHGQYQRRSGAIVLDPDDPPLPPLDHHHLAHPGRFGLAGEFNGEAGRSHEQKTAVVFIGRFIKRKEGRNDFIGWASTLNGLAVDHPLLGSATGFSSSSSFSLMLISPQIGPTSAPLHVETPSDRDGTTADLPAPDASRGRRVGNEEVSPAQFQIVLVRQGMDGVEHIFVWGRRRRRDRV